MHITRTQADALGISFGGCERDFAALTVGRICHGTAILTLGAARIENVPVAVHEDGMLATAAIAKAFGVELGPVIGTNILEQFLATIDAPRNRVILSARGEVEARAKHRALLPSGEVVEARFGRLGSHLMIAPGRLHERATAFFVDSGLAAVRDDQGQASLLISSPMLEQLGIVRPRDGRFAELPGSVWLGGAEQSRLTAYPVPARTWREFGDWSGVRVEALLSHGFLKNYAWTLDFEHRRFWLSKDGTRSMSQ